MLKFLEVLVRVLFGCSLVLALFSFRIVSKGVDGVLGS